MHDCGRERDLHDGRYEEYEDEAEEAIPEERQRDKQSRESGVNEIHMDDEGKPLSLGDPVRDRPDADDEKRNRCDAINQLSVAQ